MTHWLMNKEGAGTKTLEALYHGAMPSRRRIGIERVEHAKAELPWKYGNIKRGEIMLREDPGFLKW
jgi:hypothetical protein